MSSRPRSAESDCRPCCRANPSSRPDHHLNPHSPVLSKHHHANPMPRTKPNPQSQTKKHSTPLSFAIAAFIVMGAGLFVYVEQRPPTPTTTSRSQPAQMFKPTPKSRRPPNTPTNVRVISLTPRRITPTPLPSTISHSNVRSGPGTHYPRHN